MRGRAPSMEREKMLPTHVNVSGPLMRITASAPPGCVAGAQMVDVLFKTYGFCWLYAEDDEAG